MATIASEKDLIKRGDCEKHINNFNRLMNDFKESFNDFKGEVRVGFAKLPEDLANKFDERYAAKHTEKEMDELKDSLKELIEKKNDRTWDILKSIAFVLLGIILIALNLN